MSTISNLHRPTSIWWPEDRIKSILNPKYIISRLQPQNIPRLFELPEWGEGLTSETYMEWILTKAARLFLILDAIRIPDRIFALVDESCDDDDLPIPEHSVDRLCLSPDGDDISLDTKFFDTQWRFLVQGIAQGDHLVYTQDEDVPVESVRTITGRSLHGRADSVDRVILAGSVCRVYMRTQVQIGGAPHFVSSDEVLTELRNLRTLSHEHLVSVYASYLKNDCVSVLFTGAANITLQHFLTDEPMSFKRLAKEQRRRILISWPHCLASAVSWLHAHGHTHGAIRPSNILVDADFHICLGQFQALDSLLSPPQVNDLDAYNYSAPERWTKPPVSVPVPVQQKHPQSQSQTILPSGGRSKRRQRPPRLTLAPLNEIPLSSPDHPRPDSSTSKGTVIRIGQPGSPSRYSFAFSSSSSSSGISPTSSIHNHPLNPKHKRISAFWPRKSKSIQTPSIISSSTSSSTTSSTSSSTSSISISTSPSDIFSLAATSLDILTILHKKSISAFTAHRAARNRLPGRGGGVADASFHLPRNAVQVQSWIALLEGEAQKRCRRER
ncbi:hypothetical protein N7475_000347 [Penicillium sp. IBT 31633x]|nr:hypothetical protein N7475_000347 [Penicillium sp. IBT 31633x]